MLKRSQDEVSGQVPGLLASPVAVCPRVVRPVYSCTSESTVHRFKIGETQTAGPGARKCATV